MNATGVMVLAHGSRKAEANDFLIRRVGDIQTRMHGRVAVAIGFLQNAAPTIKDALTALAGQGCRRIRVIPYFLAPGNHVTQDVPEELAQLKKEYGGMEFEYLEPIGMRPELGLLLEELVRGAIPPPVVESALRPDTIEQTSLAWISSLVDTTALGGPEAAILKRIIHATCDFSLPGLFRIHPDAVTVGQAALAAGRPIVTDVEMVRAGIRKSVTVHCAIRDEQVAARAAASGRTRSYEAMLFLQPELAGSIAVIGNAPTALEALLDLAAAGTRPALIIGIPVGLVGAAQSKERLMASGIPYITVAGPRGGSTMAVAAANALLILHGGMRA